jgi:hypothetical protein
MPIWGVDSYSPAHLTAEGSEGHSIYEFVCNYLSRNRRLFGEIQAPQFWGRYLSQSRPRSSLTAVEKEFLHSRGCRIVLVYNDTSWDQHHDVDCRRELGGGRHMPLGLTGYQNGAVSAANACRLANNLSVPDGTRLYADLEGWRVDADWLDGWCTEVPDASLRLGRRYVAGIYGRVLGTAELAVARRTYRRLPDAWSGHVDQVIRGRQEREGRLIQGVRLSSPIHIWSNMPRWGRRCEGVPESFQGSSTLGGQTRTVVWQYGMGCPNLAELVDMDLATQEGFDEMWRPAQ